MLKPSPVTIRNWELPLGFYQLQKPVRKGSKWAMIIDASVMLGQQKLLMVLGIDLSRYHFEQAINLDMVEVLGVHVAASFKSETIKKVLNDIKQNGHQIEYVVCDNGNNLRKAIRLANIAHIQDCTHALGLLIEKRYKTAEHFNSFSKRSALFKRQISLSKHAALIPPVQRSKGRFLNLEGICKWAQKVLNLAGEYRNKAEYLEVYKTIKWIEDYQDLINDMVVHITVLHKIFKILKNKGLSQLSEQGCTGITLIQQGK